MPLSNRPENRKVLTLCFVTDGGRVLLGMKKRGFGAGRWNGFGGKLEAGETVEAAARRELSEEAGIEADALSPAGVLVFEYRHTGAILEVRVFRVAGYRGEPTETEEMRPAWFSFDDFPYDQAWPDDRHWMPHFLAGKSVSGRFIFSDYDTITESVLDVE